jgi:hypothetical protein
LVDVAQVQRELDLMLFRGGDACLARSLGRTAATADA